MHSRERFLYRTHYFKRTYTWVKRGFVMLFLAIGALMLPLDEGLGFLNFVLAAIVIIYFIVKPKDDLAVTPDYLLHISRSVVKKFTRIEQYKISEITSIRAGGIHSDGWELVDVFNGGGNMGGYSNTVEISFSDGRSTSLQLAIDRKKLDRIVELVYDQRDTLITQKDEDS